MYQYFFQDFVPLPSPLGLKTDRTENIALPDFITLPKYSSTVQSLLDAGKILQEWDKFVEETAYHILALPYKFETKDMYQELGRMLYRKYPCIGFSTGNTPWVRFILSSFYYLFTTRLS